MAINKPLSLDQAIKQILESLDRQLDTLKVPTRLFMVGSLLKKGTKSSYEQTGPLEILIDGKTQDWLWESVVRRYFTLMSDKDLYDLDDAEEAGENLLRHLPVANIQEMQSWTLAIQGDNCPSIREALDREDFKPKAMVLHVNINSENDIYFVKALNESVLLKNKRILIVEQDCFTIDHQGSRKILLDEYWDAVQILDRIILFNESKALLLFKFYEKVLEEARVTLNQLAATQLFADVERISDYVQKRVRYQKKLAQVKSFLLSEIEKDRLISLIQDHKIKLQMDEEGKIVCESEKDVQIILDIIMDNFVKSMITEREYKALNKSRLKNS